MLKQLQAITLAAFLAAPTVASAQAEVVYEAAANAEEQAIAASLQANGVVETVKDAINESFRLDKTVTFVMGGNDGPLFDPSNNRIIIPYFFLQDVKQRFVAAKYEEEGLSADEATMDALRFTLFHELAHALIAMYELPVLGKEEDAADGLASVLLINFFEEGQEIALNAADFFLLATEGTELNESDFWGEHSLDEQRFFSTLCYVYGSDPKKYADIKQEAEFTEDRALGCEDDYARLVNSWLDVLKPYLKGE